MSGGHRATPAVTVLAPVLGRPGNAQPLAESLRTASPDADLLFLCSPGDDEQIAACLGEGWTVIVDWEPGPGDYARKINYGFQLAADQGSEWMLLGADDLRFHTGWDRGAIAVYEETGVCVVGTNDLGNQAVISGRHSTHSLVHADYWECGTIDEDDKILHDGYDHNWVDNEFVETARARDTFASCGGCVVEHAHPFWGKARDDDTYRKGRVSYHADRRLYQRRRRLWR